MQLCSLWPAIPTMCAFALLGCSNPSKPLDGGRGEGGPISLMGELITPWKSQRSDLSLNRASISTHTHPCIHTCTHTHTQTVHTHTHTHTHIHTYTHTHTYVHTHTHTHTHSYIHIYTHTHTHCTHCKIMSNVCPLHPGGLIGLADEMQIGERV